MTLAAKQMHLLCLLVDECLIYFTMRDLHKDSLPGEISIKLTEK